MKVKSLVFTLLIILSLNSWCQSFELKFTADQNNNWVQLDSVKVYNLTQNTEYLHIWPDTVQPVYTFGGEVFEFLLVGYTKNTSVDIKDKEINPDRLLLLGSYPNPMVNSTMISFFIPRKGNVSLVVFDMKGRKLNTYNNTLEKGTHSFRLSSIPEKMVFLAVQWSNSIQSLKVLSVSPEAGTKSRLEYIGARDHIAVTKSDTIPANILESGIFDIPSGNKTYTFQFAKDIPCLDQPSVTYEGKVYNAVQIFSQCWLTENLNVGTMINGDQEQTDNGIVEKYCMNNNIDSCSKYGGLYQWNEVMNYNESGDTNCLCPPGWHIPTDIEWQILEGVADSKFGIVDSVWTSNEFFRGFDQGLNLKSQTSWADFGNGTDIFGFGVLGAGQRFTDGTFSSTRTYSNFWSSTNDNWYTYPYTRRFAYYSDRIHRQSDSGQMGYSVRCIKNQ